MRRCPGSITNLLAVGGRVFRRIRGRSGNEKVGIASLCQRVGREWIGGDKKIQNDKVKSIRRVRR